MTELKLSCFLDKSTKFKMRVWEMILLAMTALSFIGCLGDTNVMQTKIRSNTPVRFYRPIRLQQNETTTIMEGQKFSKANDDVNEKSTSKRSHEDEGELKIHSPLDPKQTMNSNLNFKLTMELKRLSEEDAEKGGEKCVTRVHIKKGGEVEDEEQQRVLMSASVYAIIYGGISMAKDRDQTTSGYTKIPITIGRRNTITIMCLMIHGRQERTVMKHRLQPPSQDVPGNNVNTLNNTLPSVGMIQPRHLEREMDTKQPFLGAVEVAKKKEEKPKSRNRLRSDKRRVGLVLLLECGTK